MTDMRDEQEFLPDTLKECIEEIDDLEVNVDSIKDQIKMFDEGVLVATSNDWRHRAASALIANKRNLMDLKRHKKRLEAEEREESGDAARISFLKAELDKVKKYAENVKGQLAGCQLSIRNAKIDARIKRLRSETEKRALKLFIRSIDESLLPKAYAAVHEALVTAGLEDIDEGAVQ